MLGRPRKGAPKEINTQLEFELALHGKSQGGVAMKCFDSPGGVTNEAIPRIDVQKDLNAGIYYGEVDSYITVNTFFSGIQNTAHLKRLCTFYSDIDCEKAGYTPEEVYHLLWQEVFGQTLPIPSVIVFSGRGLHIYWFLADEDCKALPSWDRVQKYIFEQLKEYGADGAALDAARILRLPFTINSTNGKMVEVWEYNNIEYTIKEFMQEYGIPEPVSLEKRRASRPPSEKQLDAVARIAKERGEEPPVMLTDADASEYITKYGRKDKKDRPKHRKAETKPGRSGRVLFLQTGSDRIRDLETLATLRKGEHCGRELIIHYLSTWTLELCKDREEAWDWVQKDNQLFQCPLGQAELLKTFRAAIKKGEISHGYEYRDRTIMETLKITPEEQKYLHYFTEEAIAGRERRRRMSKEEQDADRYQQKLAALGKLSKHQELEARLSVLSAYLEKGGMTVEAICKEMRISRATYYRLKNKLESQDTVPCEKIETPAATAEEPVPAAPKFVVDATTDTEAPEQPVLPVMEAVGSSVSEILYQAPALADQVSHSNSVSFFSPVFHQAPLRGAAYTYCVYPTLRLTPGDITRVAKLYNYADVLGELSTNPVETADLRGTACLVDTARLRVRAITGDTATLGEGASLRDAVSQVNSIARGESCRPDEQKIFWQPTRLRSLTGGVSDLTSGAKTAAEGQIPAWESSAGRTCTPAGREGGQHPGRSPRAPLRWGAGHLSDSAQPWLTTGAGNTPQGPPGRSRMALGSRQGRDPPNASEPLLGRSGWPPGSFPPLGRAEPMQGAPPGKLIPRAW